MAASINNIYDALAMIESFKGSARTLLGEEDSITKKLGEIENNVYAAGRSPAEDPGRIHEPWINQYPIAEVTDAITAEFTLAIVTPLIQADQLFNNYCRILKDDRNNNRTPNTTARGVIHQNIATLCIAPAKEAMSRVMQDATKSPFLEIAVGALVQSLRLPTVGNRAVAQANFRQARIEAAKTKKLLEDLDGFFKELRDKDQETR